MQSLDLLISQIAKALGFAEPGGITLSYEFGGIWIDIFVGKDQGSWEVSNFGLSVPAEKAESLRDLVDNIGLDPQDVRCEQERAYVNLSEEEWERANQYLTTLL